MRRSGRRPVALLTALLVLWTPFICLADRSGNCFEEAAMSIHPGSRLTITGREGASISGRLQFADFREKVLTIETATPDRDPVSFRLGDVSSIRYETSASVPAGMAAGGVLGFAVGAVTAGIIVGANDRCSCSCFEPNPTGGEGLAALAAILGLAVGGTVAGMLTGAVLAGTRRIEHTIECGPRTK